MSSPAFVLADGSSIGSRDVGGGVSSSPSSKRGYVEGSVRNIKTGGWKVGKRLLNYGYGNLYFIVTQTFPSLPTYPMPLSRELKSALIHSSSPP